MTGIPDNKFQGAEANNHLFFLLQISERCPSVCEAAKEDKEEEIAEAVPSGLKVTSADHQNQEA